MLHRVTAASFMHAALALKHASPPGDFRPCHPRHRPCPWPYLSRATHIRHTICSSWKVKPTCGCCAPPLNWHAADPRAIPNSPADTLRSSTTLRTTSDTRMGSATPGNSHLPSNLNRSHQPSHSSTLIALVDDGDGEGAAARDAALPLLVHVGAAADGSESEGQPDGKSADEPDV